MTWVTRVRERHCFVNAVFWHSNHKIVVMKRDRTGGKQAMEGRKPAVGEDLKGNQPPMVFSPKAWHLRKERGHPARHRYRSRAGTPALRWQQSEESVFDVSHIGLASRGHDFPAGRRKPHPGRGCSPEVSGFCTRVLAFSSRWCPVRLTRKSPASCMRSRNMLPHPGL